MKLQTLEGKVVTVSSARGPVVCTVVADLGNVIVVGSHEDYIRARSGGIGRFAVGFPRTDILSQEGIDNKGMSQA